MATLETVRHLTTAEKGFATVVTVRDDGTAQATVVNAGLVEHPVEGYHTVGFISPGASAKVANIRARGHATVNFRSGWQWATVEGPAELAGPDDPLDGVEPDGVPGLLREVFTAIGGTHDDWAEFDRVMAAERRAAVFVTPHRIYSNPGS